MTLPLERHWRNVAWALCVEAFWGISLALISVVAIVPVFLSHLGASNTVIGLLPAIWTLMAFLPGAFGSHFTSHLPLRKQAVFVFHALSGIPWVLLAAWFGLGSRHAPALDRPNTVADLATTTKRVDDDVGVEEDACYGRRRRTRRVSLRSRLTYPLVSPISLWPRHRPSIARSVASRSFVPAPYARRRASRTSSEIVRPCCRASPCRRRWIVSSR